MTNHLALAAATIALAASPAIQAQAAGGHGGSAPHAGSPGGRGFAPRGFGGSHGLVHPQFRRGGAVGRLGPRVRSIWSGGRWQHVWHDGFYGWWWFVDGDWFLYPEPTYPYPDYVAPYAFDESAPSEPAPQVWYHCANPEGYYPYVKFCSGGWEQVPAMPGPDDRSMPPPDAPPPGER
jgi:hypothetical protein